MIFYHHGTNADLAQSRSFMQGYNQLNYLSVPVELAKCNVLELDAAGNVFSRFSLSRVVTGFDSHRKP